MIQLIELMLSDYSIFAFFSLFFFFIVGLGQTLLEEKAKIQLNPMALIRLESKGIISFTALSVVVSIFKISIYLIIICGLFYIAVIYKKRNHISLNLDEFTQKHIAYSIVSFLTLLLFFGYGSLRIWPPMGDISTAHGPLVERFTNLGHLPLTVNELEILYPPGFHILCSSLNEVFGFYSIQIIFYVMIFVTALIPLMNYLIVQEYTGSELLGLCGFVLSLYRHPSNHMDRYFLGPLFNGTYPYLFGFFIVQTLVLYVIRFKSLDEENLWTFLTSSFIGFFSLFCVYPTFSVILGISFLSLIVFHYQVTVRSVQNVLAQNRLYLLGISVLVIGILGIKPEVINVFQYFTSKFAYNGQDVIALTSSESFAYKVDFNIYFAGALGMLSLFSLLIGGLSKKIRETSLFSLFLPVMCVILISGAFESINQHLFLLTPNRSALIARMMGIVIFLDIVYQYIDRIRLPIIQEYYSGLLLCTKKITLVLVLILCSTLVYPNFIPRYKKTFQSPASQKYDDDFKALVWVQENCISTDVILGESTWVGFYGQSFTQAEFVHHQYNRITNQKRDRDLWQVWLHPGNETLVANLLGKYNVTYIVVTSSDYQFDLLNTNTQMRDPAIYLRAFGGYNFLEPMFSIKDTVVYSVRL